MALLGLIMVIMDELHGNIWHYHDRGDFIAITTNGDVNARGECVMGRGVALQAKMRYRKLPRIVGEDLRRWGNHVRNYQQYRLFTFPVKHHWHEKADLDLIVRSCVELSESSFGIHVYLTRPGCGNGGLDWKVVKPAIDGLLDDRFTIVDLAF